MDILDVGTMKFKRIANQRFFTIVVFYNWEMSYVVVFIVGYALFYMLCSPHFCFAGSWFCQLHEKVLKKKNYIPVSRFICFFFKVELPLGRSLDSSLVRYLHNTRCELSKKKKKFGESFNLQSLLLNIAFYHQIKTLVGF